uniref:Caspase 1-like protein n=1 Tax=Locusta migratoria TaxID=7004 RepID=A0A3S6Q0H6_LOCMI|nr:caspase 1-like protein [Locusta migratoria]
MNHKWRGEAHIFYHKTFEMKRSPRNGTEDDRDKLVLTFQNLDFNVKCHNDLSLSEIEGILRDVAARDHTDCDCLVVAVLTHCGLDKLLVARDEEYDISTLLNPFIGSRCRGLATKPKLFFIQTCKGEYGDLQGRGPRRGDSIDGVPDLAPLKTYQVPSHADILIWYAPFDEQYDRTRYKEPSCVRCLHSVFAKRDTSLHLVSLLTDVTRQFGELGYRRGERVPCFTTSLTRLLYFP